ncbi:5-methyltetrahydropteroyltriglutamate--homocysteine S-methyltransferase [Geomonas sp. RF6]|uniref:5-methyltetrahydropteroyltriglutamate-- homocysteine S-methyltransferase n=1 Tax=Geomonas sp. RF6 TaxID=2897342 RepID=UPI001E2A3D24|nr:5-methyltetrahydropteroyltriglutamate--homocysteine S-methyltransferase [Geomonas sp. RF6]UFS70424.1 5-methyltetrahydropteroyltriglutamate--homocysteine S-methyltransferase [Geomonas sp. RF6]
MLTHNLGYPRIGRRRELKEACERYWAGESTLEELLSVGQTLRRSHWLTQREAGLDLIPCNDFSYYDHVLDMSQMVGAIPPRYAPLAGLPAMDLAFAMARGYQKDGHDLIAMEMTKWFDTNYHYLVPEFHKAQTFTVQSSKALDEFLEAKALGMNAKPVLLGPVSYLMLGKEKEGGFHRLQLLERLLPVYAELMRDLFEAGAEFVQVDEPFLSLDLEENVVEAYRTAYRELKRGVPGIRIILTSYFDGLRNNIPLAVHLPVHTVHLDLQRAPEQLEEVLAAAPEELCFSLGVVDGRNIWRNDFSASLALIRKAIDAVGSSRLMIAPSCSLLHVPYDTALESGGGALPEVVLEWLAFARQKVGEVCDIAYLASSPGSPEAALRLAENALVVQRRRSSPLLHNEGLEERLADVAPRDLRRESSFEVRSRKQAAALNLPLFPTTTIGSFPQTTELRRLRNRLRKGEIDIESYREAIEAEIVAAVRWQEEAGIDVLVHGEFERADMVEYFGRKLDGCGFTAHGWVQSYGSRCVKPPVIYGDVVRKGAMTVRWSDFARCLTRKPMKGMLTGPVTILQWSFARDDQPRRETARQLALAIRDEVRDLERAGLKIIQIDEPAFREGMPLRKGSREEYLSWAVEAFRLASSGVRDETQIHTHMCYSEFNDIMPEIAALDADVITIETSRSQMELLEAFNTFRYPNAIGPGVFDVHTPRVPTVEEMVTLLRRALSYVPKERLWVNPDCGLKTRRWEETKAALSNMVAAARILREEGGEGEVEQEEMPAASGSAPCK